MTFHHLRWLHVWSIKEKNGCWGKNIKTEDLGLKIRRGETIFSLFHFPHLLIFSPAVLFKDKKDELVVQCITCSNISSNMLLWKNTILNPNFKKFSTKIDWTFRPWKSCFVLSHFKFIFPEFFIAHLLHTSAVRGGPSPEKLVVAAGRTKKIKSTKNQI